MKHIFFSHHEAQLKTKGFTLIELLVVIAVSATIAAMAIQGFPAYSEKADFENLVLDVALTIREAQVYGLGTREAGSAGFDVAYGVHVSSASAEKTSLVFFVDKDNDGVYDGVPAGEHVRTLAVKSGYFISRLCTDDACVVGRTALDISFKRPSPSARFTAEGVGGFLVVPKASIEISSPSGTIKRVEVFSSGQISTP